MNAPDVEDLELERYARRRARRVDPPPRVDYRAPAKRVRKFVTLMVALGVLLGGLAFSIAWTSPGSYEAFKRWVARTPVLQDVFDDEGDWQIPLP